MQIVVDDLILNYEQIGTGSKDLVILHGWGCSLKEWIPIARKTKGYRVTLLDLPGFGFSEEPHKSINIFQYTEVFSKFLNKVNINKCIIVGHSFGGRIGTIFASNNSDIVEKLILVDAGGIEIKSTKTKILILLSKLLKPFKIFFPKKIRKILESSDYKNAPRILRESFVKIINQDLRYLFPNIKIPVVVIWGSNDSILPVWYVKIYRTLIKNVNIKIVWEANHFPHISKREEFIKILNEEI
ncbi:MAG: alpha/beta hydrolase [Candidatus Paceibacterota bacterium]